MRMSIRMSVHRCSIVPIHVYTHFYPRVFTRVYTTFYVHVYIRVSAHVYTAHLYMYLGSDFGWAHTCACLYTFPYTCPYTCLPAYLHTVAIHLSMSHVYIHLSLSIHHMQLSLSTYHMQLSLPMYISTHRWPCLYITHSCPSPCLPSSQNFLISSSADVAVGSVGSDGCSASAAAAYILEGGWFSHSSR